MYISSSPHETKVAVLEDDQLVEVYFERDTDVGLVGGIYKGRVNRVLPGMQSAFVDIGLERDAFLYVSDFFYEDQEEYDKVFEEAEARATKFTTQQTDTPAPPVPVTPPPVTEIAPPVIAEVAPPPAVPPPAEPPAAAVAPPVAVTPPAPFRESRESHDRRGFDPRRGRRRRHRGRPESGEGRHGDRRFPPPHRPEEPPAESHPFEILPGESLAKYSHTASAPAEVMNAETPAGADLEDNLGPSEGYESIEGHVAPGETAELRGEAPPETEAASESTGVELAVTPELVAPVTQVEAAVPAEASPEAPPEGASVVLTDAALLFTPGAMHPGVSPTPVERTVTEPPATIAAAHVEPPPTSEIPAPSSLKAETGGEVSPPLPDALGAGEATEPPVAQEVASAPQVSAEGSAESPQAPSASGVAGAIAGEEGFESEEEVEVEELAEGGEEELAAEGELPAEAAIGAEGEGQPAVAPAAPGEVTPAAPSAPGDRTYTLREPHQRPRFAPRHRRGRRGGPAPRNFSKPRESSRPGNHHPVQIAEVLKEGQEILVQIAKEPLGTKGARITSHVALPGRYLVYMPTIDHIGVSRKIASEEERLRLRNIILENRGSLNGGFIVRTAGQGRSEDEFKADLKFLSTLWAEIRSKSDRLQAPALIHRDLDLVQRLLRDLLTPDFKCVRVDSEIDYERVLDFVNRCQPALVGKVKLYSRDTPLYEEFGIQQELDKALKPKVWLKSGGYIVINQTEALVAVDVNTGKFVGKTNRLEDTIVKTNIDAVNEIVRQVRLRDLGGIIVIDFIDMDERKNRAKVVQALEEALRFDRAPTKVISFHDFGLVAVTRKRVKQSLERTLCEPCDYCAGSGWVKSVNTVCNEILAEARKMAKGIDGDVLTLRVNPDVAKALKSREGALVSELESLTKKDVIIKSDPMVHQERFEIF
jgi:ribonuclease G